MSAFRNVADLDMFHGGMIHALHALCMHLLMQSIATEDLGQSGLRVC